METRTISVDLTRNSYEIFIGNGLLGELGGFARRHYAGGGQVAVVTDQNVWGRHGHTLAASLCEAGMDCTPVVLEPGEHNKSLAGLETVYDAFADMNLKRDGLIIAFGGGVIGDLSGFAAATYMRGVKYIQVPTTLLAQVDSSVGGKTAINLKQGKNMAGAFYQPAAVLIDTAVLETLSKRDWRCGMAEVIKHGAIRSRCLFDELKNSANKNRRDFLDIIARNCKIKSEIVARDERETGERALLNFGHTFGHAIEKLYGYSTYNHGEAVAMGMRIAAAVGQQLGLTENGVESELMGLMGLYGLATVCPATLPELLPYMQTDKKSVTGGVKLVLLRQIGKTFTHTISFNALGEILRKVEEKWKK